MKGLCTVANGEYVQFLVTDDQPEVGHYYFIESATEGTSAQNKLFHSLTMEYFRSGMHSYNCSDYGDFKDQIKRKLGEGFECFIYAEIGNNGKAYLQEAKTSDEIPNHIMKDEDMKGMIRGKLKSWANYTLKQRKKCIDNVITEMLQAGVNTKKFDEILKGIER